MKNILIVILFIFCIKGAFAQTGQPAPLLTQHLLQQMRIIPNGVYQENTKLFPGPIDILISQVEIPQGEVACVDVTVANFNNILQMEFTNSWNSNSFEFVEATNINLPGMTQADFTALIGILTVQWEDESGTGVTLPDNTVVFSLCFRATGNVGESSAVGLVTIPVNIYVTDTESNGSHVGANTSSGLLIISPPLPPLIISDAQITDVNCANPNGGSIDLTIEGGLPPYAFIWDNTADTEDLSGLTAGDYSVTVVDSHLPPETVEMTYTVQANLEEPMVDAGFDMTFTCVSNILQLDASASDSGTNITNTWTTTDGNITSGETSLNPQVDQAGTYVLTLTNTESLCTASDEVLVFDVNIPEIIVAEEVDLGCVGEVVIDASVVSAGNNIFYEWTTANGTIVMDGDTATPTVGSVGLYELLVTDNDNACSVLASVSVISDPDLPIVQVVPEETLTCFNTSVVLTASGSAEGPEISYLWTTLDGNIVMDETTLAPEVDQGGRYDLVITNNDTGCTALGTVEVISDMQAPTADAGVGLQLDCEGNNLTLDGSASSTGIEFSYQWMTDDGVIAANGTSLAPEVSAAGTYELLVTNEFNGCTASSTVEVLPNTGAPTADAGQGLMISCAGAVVTLDGSASSQGADFSYQWTTDDGTIMSGATTQTPEVSSAGSYQLVVTNTTNNCSATAMVTVSLDGNLPIAQASEDLDNCGDSILITAQIAAGVTGTWSADFNSTVFSNINSNESYVGHLIPGENYLYWTLSTPECPDYSTDTLIVYNEGFPNANDDVEITEMGEQTIAVSVLGNDNLAFVEDYNINVIAEPDGVGFLDLGDGQLEFSVSGGFVGSTQAMYELCNLACPTHCDTALASIVVENPVDPFGQTEIYFPNAITPNGDGVNDAFFVDELENNRDIYPNNELVVFNRWGDVVFQAQPYNNDWEGTNQGGGNLPHGTYYFILRLDINNNKLVKGDVTILK